MGLKLVGEVGLDGSGWEAGLKRLSGSTANLTRGLRSFALQAFGVYSIQQAFQRTVESASELVTASKRLGTGVEQLQLLRKAAGDADTELEAVTRAFEKLNETRSIALGGGKAGEDMLGNYAKLGITKSDLQNKSAADLFMGPIRNASNSASPEAIGPVLKDVIGKGFGELLPMLATDFEALEKQMRSWGNWMSTESATQLEYFNDQIGTSAQIVIAQLAPSLVQLTWTLLESARLLHAGFAWLKTMATSSGRIAPYTTPIGAVTGVLSGGNLTRQGIVARITAIVADIETTMSRGLDKAALAYDRVDEEWRLKIDALKKQLNEEAAAMKAPKPAKFIEAETPDTAGAMAKPARLQLPDSGNPMLRVGNFLGTGRSALVDIAYRQTQLLTGIFENTSALKRLAQPRPTGESLDSAFPEI